MWCDKSSTCSQHLKIERHKSDIIIEQPKFLQLEWGESPAVYYQNKAFETLLVGNGYIATYHTSKHGETHIEQLDALSLSLSV